ncbi:hypothetical protein [Polyangium sp. 6x1]|uniref:hypothetical protein n=1 Tax=Polyangium sp. 6x1 TaxID=3042689 RepID=UPI002482A83F|nr:hypothetical protein [Polyangium sp. 6x1]MDI1450827.1 hypothetical protein [Polyangium sp. 6x1]
MKRIVHIIASCTDRKRLPVPEKLAMRNVRADSGERFEQWWRALAQDRSPTLPAVELYVGDHWSVVRELPAVAKASGLQAHLWVASAGYGLVPAEASLHAYAATFSSGHADSVLVGGSDTRSTAARAWWKRLAEAPAPPGSGPRTLAALARSAPNAMLLVVASPRYLAALEDDLIEAQAHLRAPDDLLIVSGSPGPTSDALKPCWLPSTAALQAELGGALGSLHARVARRILQEAADHGLKTSEVRRRLAELERQQAPAARPDREPMTDDQVVSFIQEQLAKDAGATHTRLLRSLRDGGRACEQSRFRRLFLQTRGS